MSYLYSPQNVYGWPSSGYEQPRPQYTNGTTYAQGYNSLRDSSISSYTPSPTYQNFVSYQPQVATSSNYSSPTYQNGSYYPVNSQPQSYSVPVSKTQNHFSFAPQQTTYTSYHAAGATSQTYQTNAPAFQTTHYSPSPAFQQPVQIAPKPYLQPYSGPTYAADSLRQSYHSPSDVYNQTSRLNDSSYLGTGGIEIRSSDPLRGSYNTGLTTPQVHLYGRSNSVGQKVIDTLRGSIHVNQESDAARNRNSVSFDRRNQPTTVDNLMRSSISSGYQNNNSPVLENISLYDRPATNAPAWNMAATPVNGNQVQGNGQAKPASPNSTSVPVLSGSFHKASEESFHQSETSKSKSNSRPSSYRPQQLVGDLTPSARSLSPDNKQNNPLLLGMGSTPSKGELKNLNIPNTPGSFIISENSSPTTPDSRSQSTHGKSLRSIKLFETPGQHHHAYPSVGHQPFNPSVPLSVSNSRGSLPPVKIDIHTDSCYNYLNKRMYKANHDAHTPLEQFFFRESVGQFKVAQMLAPLLPTVTMPSPVKIPRRKKYLLVLDIDETLVHSELIVEQNVPKPEKADVAYDRQLKFPNPNGTFDVYGIRFRPFLMEFLHRMSKLYDLALYTASAEDYGNAVANELDPAGTLFVARLFRQHCIHVNGVNVKSMKNFEGNDAYLVDNLIYSFPFDLDRGIPICPFVDDAMDVELKDLAEILENLPCYDSMHSLVTELLGLEDFYGFLRQKSMRNSHSQPVTPILQKHESATQGSNDRTAGTNTIYF